ncbi:hypothetical protein FSP39_004111 [Pinctada imbricata]|uniref:Centrosomal protein of 57 kDa n=1 Tax=Pinctada imbricata TaxID=66713 RepID=A0AA88Y2K5_PINIB|nr:hypothetical protein FSP39_004111 [Pinctada imbricata]
MTEIADYLISRIAQGERHFMISVSPNNSTSSQTYSPQITTSGKSPGKRPLYRNQDQESVNSTTYHDYPNKPFINSDYHQHPDKPVKALPENNRTAVISALKNLQEKIRRLEVERGAAESNLKTLAQETVRYKDILQKEHASDVPVQSTVSKHTQELESQLSAAESRSRLLEKQLDNMRKMVVSAEQERQETMMQTSLEKDKSDNVMLQVQPGPPPDYLSHREKLTELEREYLKLAATQTLSEYAMHPPADPNSTVSFNIPPDPSAPIPKSDHAPLYPNSEIDRSSLLQHPIQNKIRDLEDKLQEERHHRKLMQERAAQMESVARTNRLLQDTESKAKKSVKKKKKVSKKQKPSNDNHVPQPTDYSKHYRLNLAEIPFVAGKSLTASHSVGANVQRVLALMKSHNMALCTALDHNSRDTSPSSTTSSSESSIDSDLAELLLQLQDEFGQMSFEHQELSREITEATDPRIKDDLERELDSLVTRMEAKSQQISKVEEKKRKKKAPAKRDRSQEPNRPVSAKAYCAQNGEVEVTTTIKTRGKSSGFIRVRPSSARDVSLNVLKDMKKLQTTLRKDDLTWE